MRHEFSKATKLAAWDRCKGHCECGCDQKIITPEYDHYPIPASLDGPATLDNCRVLDKRCHRVRTAKIDNPALSKSQRIYEKRANARARGRGFRRPYGAAYDWTQGRYVKWT